jgi:hypothetical protein
MVFFSSDWGASKFQVIPRHDGRDSSDLAFVVWGTVVLAGLAVLSIVLGVATVDPAIFAAP